MADKSQVEEQAVFGPIWIDGLPESTGHIATDTEVSFLLSRRGAVGDVRELIALGVVTMALDPHSGMDTSALAALGALNHMVLVHDGAYGVPISFAPEADMWRLRAMGLIIGDNAHCCVTRRGRDVVEMLGRFASTIPEGMIDESIGKSALGGLGSVLRSSLHNGGTLRNGGGGECSACASPARAGDGGEDAGGGSGGADGSGRGDGSGASGAPRTGEAAVREPSPSGEATGAFEHEGERIDFEAALNLIREEFAEHEDEELAEIVNGTDGSERLWWEHVPLRARVFEAVDQIAPEHPGRDKLVAASALIHTVMCARERGVTVESGKIKKIEELNTNPVAEPEQASRYAHLITASKLNLSPHMAPEGWWCCGMMLMAVLNAVDEQSVPAEIKTAALWLRNHQPAVMDLGTAVRHVEALHEMARPEEVAPFSENWWKDEHSLRNVLSVVRSQIDNSRFAGSGMIGNYPTPFWVTAVSRLEQELPPVESKATIE